VRVVPELDVPGHAQVASVRVVRCLLTLFSVFMMILNVFDGFFSLFFMILNVFDDFFNFCFHDR
jgi:hypothetical protein